MYLSLINGSDLRGVCKIELKNVEDRKMPNVSVLRSFD
jgi:hypothetical protein